MAHSMESVGKKVALVTGATGVIGKEIARQIAQKPEFEVVLLCRNKEKAQRAVEDIKKSTANNKVRYEWVDLSSRSSIRNLSKCWQGPVHVLLNNAAVTPQTRQETGKYYEHLQQTRCRFGEDRKAVEELYQICSDLYN